MALNGNSDTTNGYNSVIANGFDADARHIKSVIPPIGTVMPWLKSLSGTPALPDGWVECDGSTISDADSPYDGVTIPNLTNQFLYGASTSGGTKTEDFLPSHKHTFYGHPAYPSGAYQRDYGAAATDSNAMQNTTSGTAWEGYAVVWIMRIK